MSKLSDQQLLDELQKRFQQNNETLCELREMTDKLVNVNKKLEESESMKSHFISNITNDIINPFASILGLTEHLMNMTKEDYEKMQDFARMIHEEAFELDFQLKNIFAAAKLEAGEFFPEISNVKVIDLITNVINTYKILSDKKHITIDFQCTNSSITREQDFFKTDPDKLHLACSNLLSNSILFSPENSEIVLTLTITDDYIEFSFKDQGIGISRENSDKIFDRFYRINHSINSENKGLGLGLAVTKGVLEMMGGGIRLERSDKGTVFTVNMPEDCSGELVGQASSNGNEVFFDEENEIF